MYIYGRQHQQRIDTNKDEKSEDASPTIASIASKDPAVVASV
jgi:hypothetical protein